MRKIKFEEYNKKRQAAKIEFLNIRDKLNKEVSQSLRRRKEKKREILYKVAKEKKQRTLKKIGNRKYKFI